MEKPDTITVSVRRREEVRADRAEIYLSVTGASFVTGDAAIKKAKEVSQLVNELGAVGVNSDDIALRGVQASGNSGILGRSSTASYLLRVQCAELEKLADILGVITAQKNVSLDQLTWRYPDDSSVRAKWLMVSLAEAKEKGQQMAAALGVKLLGVHALTERCLEEEDQKHAHFPASGRAALGAKPRKESIDLGFFLVTTKEVTVEVEAHFRVSGYEP